MALFKIAKGLKANLPSVKTAGHCWYTTDDSLFYIDYEDENGEIQRKALNAKDAETIMGASLATILNDSEVEIPTSSAIFVALAEKADINHTHEEFDQLFEDVGSAITNEEIDAICGMTLYTSNEVMI